MQPRSILIALLLVVLAACSAAPPKKATCPVDGGIGGTGGACQTLQ